MPRPPEGVTVAVCCHNSTGRLGPTLQHLSRQNPEPGILWEVLVVDNASSDGTASFASSGWPADAAAPLRVVAEPRAGLQFARERAFAEARYPILSFVDDDNWVGPDWIARTSRAFAEHPEIGACGGFSEAVCEVPPPSWFDRLKPCFAVGAQGFAEGEQPGYRPLLWGAGLGIRRAAMDALRRLGFCSTLADRQGDSLLSGGDTEFCLALRLAGWRLWYDPGLRLRHFLPAGRLRWEYVRRLHRGFGASVNDAYHFALGEGIGEAPPHKRRWSWVFARELWCALRQAPALWRLRGSPAVEPDWSLLPAEHSLGRIGALWRLRSIYDARTRAVATAPWRQAGPPAAP